MTSELLRGAESAAAEMQCANRLDIETVRAVDARPADLLGADGYLFCAPENLAALSGEMKEFFDRSYYGVFETHGDGHEAPLIAGRPYGLAIAAGSDGRSAARQAERICRGWRLAPVGDAVIQRSGRPQTAEDIMRPGKACPEDGKRRLRELGGLVAATLLL
jgi:multimeric flavodoxin WrbA